MNSILVIDDTPANLQLLTGLLSDCGHEVRAVQDGAFALKSAHTAPPDLIVLDIRMPGMDGYEVCKRLKADERTREIPVIFLSALDDMADKLKGFQVGGVDYITKPFQAQEVLARIETHLTLRNLRRDVEEKNRQLQDEVQWRKQAEEEMRALNDHLDAGNRQLEQTNQQLLEANASKDAFFSIIAHDLRSPFTSLLGLTQALLEEGSAFPPETLQRMLENLHASAEHTYALLTNLLEWSRLERGYTECHPESLPLKPLVEKNIHLVAHHAEQKQIVLQYRMADNIAAYADLAMIDTVVRNLLSNAVKFTEAGGSIDVAAQAQHDAVDISISDSGIGMDIDTLNALFRIDKKTSQPGTAGEHGSGLGLILCRELVEKNGGSIRVNSVKGQGTTFTFSLPAGRGATKFR